MFLEYNILINELNLPEKAKIGMFCQIQGEWNKNKRKYLGNLVLEIYKRQLKYCGATLNI